MKTAWQTQLEMAYKYGYDTGFSHGERGYEKDDQFSEFGLRVFRTQKNKEENGL